MEQKKSQLFGILAIIFCFVPVIFLFFGGSLKALLIVSIIAIIMEIASFVLAIIGIKNSMALSIVSIIFSIIFILIFGLCILVCSVFSSLDECVLSSDGETATCKFMGETVEDVPAVLLTDDQIVDAEKNSEDKTEKEELPKNNVEGEQ